MARRSGGPRGDRRGPVTETAAGPVAAQVR
ncbi:MAG: hypothetical protein JWL60_1801, partial [Gemmatimonadetes bacterium]|nr:hypothetical protein [Gemmatimonadota bacterium]